MNEEGKPSGNYWKPCKKNKVGFCGEINVSLREFGIIILCNKPAFINDVNIE